MIGHDGPEDGLIELVHDLCYLFCFVYPINRGVHD